MLQITTGKLFTHPPRRENFLRSVLYTNALIHKEEPIVTAAGKLLPSSSYSTRPFALIYELTERIEDEGGGDGKAGTIVSFTVDPYLHDFALVASFALNCVCSPDLDLARRLTSGEQGQSTRVAPNALVSKFFDRHYGCKPGDIRFLVSFIDQVIGLHRKTFLGVMRSIRTYVNAMHRVADNLELAYTLLVASVESLAQDFDGHQADWLSVDDRKRNAIDAALHGAGEALTQRVRNALLEFEHVALARRFREFAVAHTPSSFFREISECAGHRLGRSDLTAVLGTAYALRSKYVHRIQRLPDMVALPNDHSETTNDGRTAYLTLQGLSRLMRSVIIEFVMRQPTIDTEPYNYQLERAGVVQVRLAPRYWVGRSDGDIKGQGREKLEGFLEQLESCLLRDRGATLTDLRPVLTLAAEFAATLKQHLRRPYLALYALFNIYLPEREKLPMPPAFQALMEKELDVPSPEAMIAFALFDQAISWSLESHQEAIDTYFRRRTSPSGIRFPRLFDAAITLELAERYRKAGDMERCRSMVALAVENHPGHERLLELEARIDCESSISWRDVLLPQE
ncbi:hypothetical protein ACQVBX_05690 [Dyella sp. KULCS107]|uniref:hypothetical protein n=1 Tax=Dyella sp. KULCS107 TaxID=3422216 RepID=UPI003D6FDDE3